MKLYSTTVCKSNCLKGFILLERMCYSSMSPKVCKTITCCFIRHVVRALRLAKGGHLRLIEITYLIRHCTRIRFSTHFSITLTMDKQRWIFYSTLLIMWNGSGAYDKIRILSEHPLQHIDHYLQNLAELLSEILKVSPPTHCMGVITDALHYPLYGRDLFQGLKAKPSMYYFIKANYSEDSLSPHYQTVRILKEMHRRNCDKYIITFSNGIQVARLLRFINRHRILSAHEHFILLHDERLLEYNMLAIWSNMIYTILLKKQPDHAYDIQTLAYPQTLHNVLVTQTLTTWHSKKRLKYVNLFPNKVMNLKGTHLNVAVFEHVPMVIRHNSSGHMVYKGVEVEIVKALGKVLNFVPHFYETLDHDTERWGRQLPNGSYTGLIGQLTNRTAKIAIGNLQLLTQYYTILDFTRPHSYECLTFLTPESSEDNAWKTLIQPFKGNMWAGVLVSLFLVGTVFYMMSLAHALLLNRFTAGAEHFKYLRRKFLRKSSRPARQLDFKTLRNVRFRLHLHQMRLTPYEDDLFDSFSNCILLTYSMLLFVSLPRMPRNWPLRMLTGWYWLYCILLAVTYRASFTAILANPAPRITINTLEELVSSGVTTTAWGGQNKKFFEEAFDDIAQEIGRKMEIIDDIDDIARRIVQGKCAYYDNVYFLRHLRHRSSTRSGGEEDILHIMQECVINMPVALGLEKNSPLKKHIDKHLQQLVENGLISKWLKDAISHLPAEEMMPPEAIMNLQKFWSSFVALAFGFFLAVCSIIWERIHFKHFVQKHPMYDYYNPGLYYKFKRCFPHIKNIPK